MILGQSAGAPISRHTGFHALELFDRGRIDQLANTESTSNINRQISHHSINLIFVGPNGFGNGFFGKIRELALMVGEPGKEFLSLGWVEPSGECSKLVNKWATCIINNALC